MQSQRSCLQGGNGSASGSGSASRGNTLRSICFDPMIRKRGSAMNDIDGVIKRIKAAYPGADTAAAVRSDLTVMLLKSRDFPDGDDVCIGALPCVAKIPLNNDGRRVIVISAEGRAYLVKTVSEAGDCIYTRSQEEIIL